jgi:hypothetical protein
MLFLTCIQGDDHHIVTQSTNILQLCYETGSFSETCDANATSCQHDRLLCDWLPDVNGESDIVQQDTLSTLFDSIYEISCF